MKLRSGYAYDCNGNEAGDRVNRVGLSRLQKDIPILPYNGDASIIQFLNQFEKLVLAKGWDANEACAWLAVLLEGPAALHYDSLAEAVRKDYNNLKNALLAKFNTTEIQALKLQQLGRISQRNGESVAQYYTRMMSIAEIAYSNLTLPQKKPMLLNHLCIILSN